MLRKDGTLFIITEEGGVVYFKPKDYSKDFKREDNLPDTSICAVVLDHTDLNVIADIPYSYIPIAVQTRLISKQSYNTL